MTEATCIDTLLQERIEGDFEYGGAITAVPEGYLVRIVQETFFSNKNRRGFFQYTVLLNKNFRTIWQTEYPCGCRSVLNDMIPYKNGYIGAQNNCDTRLVMRDKQGREITSAPIPDLFGAMKIYNSGTGLTCIAPFEKFWEMQPSLIRLPRYGMYYIRTDSAGNELQRTELKNYSILNHLPELPVITGNCIAGICNNEIMFYNLSGQLLHTRKLAEAGKDSMSLCTAIIPNHNRGIAYINSIRKTKNDSTVRYALCSTDSAGNELFRLELKDERQQVELADIKLMRDGNLLLAVNGIGDSLLLYKISASGKVIWKTATHLAGITYMDMTETADEHIVLMCSRRIRRHTKKILFQKYDAKGMKICNEAAL